MRKKNHVKQKICKITTSYEKIRSRKKKFSMNVDKIRGKRIFEIAHQPFELPPTLVDSYIRKGNFQKNILIYHSGHTQDSETNDT